MMRQMTSSNGDFVQPEVIGVSILMNLGTTVGQTTATTTGEQRGVGLGFFTAPTNLATPDGFRGLVITTDGRLILAEHGFGGSARAGFIEEIATDIDTAVDHTLSFQINTTTGDLSNIILDGVEQPDVETTIFSSDINHVGFMVSSASGGTVASYDDFVVTDGAIGGPGGVDPVISSITPIDATTYELSIAAEPATDYVITLSPSLDFEVSETADTLTQGSPDDAGVIAPSGDAFTTDENGDAVLRFTSVAPKNFARLEEAADAGP